MASVDHYPQTDFSQIKQQPGESDDLSHEIDNRICLEKILYNAIIDSTLEVFWGAFQDFKFIQTSKSACFLNFQNSTPCCTKYKNFSTQCKKVTSKIVFNHFWSNLLAIFECLTSLKESSIAFLLKNLDSFRSKLFFIEIYCVIWQTLAKKYVFCNVTVIH